jgi:RHS repeat-associated protein
VAPTPGSRPTPPTCRAATTSGGRSRSACAPLPNARSGTTVTDDDQHALLDRSLGKITSNASTVATKPRPYQFYQADSVPGVPAQTSKAESYDDAGNLTSLSISRNTVPCTLQTDCTNLQYLYTWDEVGRLSAASKLQSGSGQTPYNPQKDSVFLYDYNDERVVKDYSEYNHLTSTKSTAYTTLYIFDSLEIRRAVFNNTTKQYPVDSTTEVGYLSANGMRLARLHYEPLGKGEPQLVTPNARHSNNLHIFLDLPDHLGSSSLIIDHATSELVEARTYQPYGATESDYRPERWKGFREDYGFTGKEEDVELGLIYFGKRYLNPFLGRWMSADPLAIHSPGQADLNLYAYVAGRVLANTDPVGLDGCPTGQECSEAGTDHPSADADRTEPEEKARKEEREHRAASFAAGYDAEAANIGLEHDIRTHVAPRMYEALIKDGWSREDAQGHVDEYISNTLRDHRRTIPDDDAARAGAEAAREDIHVTLRDTLDVVDKVAQVRRWGQAAARPGPYKRPSGATTPQQRASVQGKPCVTCGKKEPRMNADHKEPLVEQHYRNNGKVDAKKMRDVESVQPQCPSCSNKQGGFLSGFARAMKKLFGYD